MVGNPSSIGLAAGPLRFSPQVTATMLTARPRTPGDLTAPRAPTHDIPGQLSNFDGEQVTWGPWS